MSCKNCLGKPDLNLIMKDFKKDKSLTIAYLQKIQAELGYISQESVEMLSRVTGVSESEIYSVVTFYSQFTLVPKAKHNIEVCMGTACYVLGAEKTLQALEDNLKIKVNQITENGEFAITQSRCLGCCGLAPVIAVNGEIYGNVTQDKVQDVINKIKE